MKKINEEKYKIIIHNYKNYSNDNSFNENIAMHIISLEKINSDIIKTLKKYDFKTFKVLSENLQASCKYLSEILLKANISKEDVIKENNIIELCRCNKIIVIIKEEKRLVKEIIGELSQVTVMEEVMPKYKFIENVVKNCLNVIRYINENIIENNFEKINIEKVYTKEYVISMVQKDLNKIKKDICINNYKEDENFLEFMILKEASKYFMEDFNKLLQIKIAGNIKYRILAYKDFLRRLNQDIASEVKKLRENSSNINYEIKCEGYENLMFLCERYYVILNHILEEIEPIDYNSIIAIKSLTKIVNAKVLFEIFINKIKENNLNSNLMDYLINGKLLGFSSFQIYKNLGIIKTFLINIENICLEIISSKNMNKYIFILKDWNISLTKFMEKVHELINIYGENNNKEIKEIYSIVYYCLKNLEIIINSKEYEKIKFYKIKLFIHEYKAYFDLVKISKITYEEFKKSEKELNSMLIIK